MLKLALMSKDADNIVKVGHLLVPCDNDGGCAGLQPELRGRERESVQSCPGIHHQALGGMTMMIDNHHDHDQKS